MKIGLISDVHADRAALDRACDLLDRVGASRILCAGDLVGYGPDPDLVVACIAERRIASVRGNHDRWALARPAGTPDPFGGPAPSEATLDHLRRLPPVAIRPIGGRLVVIVHGVPGDDMTYLVRPTFSTADLRALLDDISADVLVVGHTHEPMWYRSPAGLVLNPGSLLSSAPRVPSSKTCVLLDLASLTPTFYGIDTGAPIDLLPWADDSPTDGSL